jgi:RNA polymerase sigma-70 factor (ECF subfamily)
MTSSQAELKFEQFDQHRRLLFSVAYRMLGSVMDAEDMVQEAFLRWQLQNAPVTTSVKAYLTTIVTRLCIDHLRSARSRREEYVGIWLPEPLLVDESDDPAEASLTAESVSVAFLVVLETLAPIERACFLLREVLGYGYGEVAEIVGESEANCRQMVSRARRRVNERRPRFDVSESDHTRLTSEFIRACSAGDTRDFLAILAEDAVVYSDGGGKAVAALNPVVGRDRVARFFAGLMSKAPPGLAISPTTINGTIGLVTTLNGSPINTITFDVQDGRIQRFYIVVNPDKLQRVKRSPR